MAMKIFMSYNRGKLKERCTRRGSLGKRLDLKPLRGLEITTLWDLLSQVDSKELSIPQMMKESRKIKDLKEV